MTARRNVFRIEQTAATRGDANRFACERNLVEDTSRCDGGDDRAGHAGGNGADAPAALRPVPACATVAPMSRLEQELHTIVNGTEQATQEILAAVEQIDAAATTLAAALNGRIEQDLAQDIRDLVRQIFEACHFQDLVGQRAAKISAALKFVEQHVARALTEMQSAATIAPHDGAHALHGPRLNSDRGHATQSDVDAMFAERRIARSG